MKARRYSNELKREKHLKPTAAMEFLAMIGVLGLTVFFALILASILTIGVTP